MSTTLMELEEQQLMLLSGTFYCYNNAETLELDLDIYLFVVVVVLFYY